jgi:hypothetical protein
MHRENLGPLTSAAGLAIPSTEGVAELLSREIRFPRLKLATKLTNQFEAKALALML